MSDTSTPAGFSLEQEDIPTVSRPGGTGREPTHWEDIVDPVRQNPGRSYRIFTYPAKQSASSRASAIRARLWKVCQNEAWTIVTRPVPGDSGEFGVYAQFDGERSQESINAELARRASIAEKRAATRDASDSVPDDDDPTPAETTSAKERVARSRATATKK